MELWNSLHNLKWIVRYVSRRTFILLTDKTLTSHELICTKFFYAHSFLSFCSRSKLFYHRKLMLLVTTVKHFFNLLLSVAHGNRGSQRINKLFEMPGGGNYVLLWRPYCNLKKQWKLCVICFYEVFPYFVTGAYLSGPLHVSPIG